MIASFIFFTGYNILAHAKVFSETEIGDIILSVSNEYNIDPTILYTIASIESDFEPLSIAVETNRRSAEILSKLRSDNIRVVFGDRKTYHSKISLISLYPKDLETASYIIELLEKNEFCFDVGLMQINTVNFTLSEVRSMFLPENNIRKAATVYDDCRKQFKRLTHRVECYNRGAKNLRKDLARNKKYYPYWDRFQEDYKKYFIGLPND